MDKLIKWLFQNTPDGATYLQVIVLVFLLCFVVFVFFDTLTISNDKEADTYEKTNYN